MDTASAGIVAFDTALGTCAVRWTTKGIAGVRLPSATTARLPRAADVPVPEPVRAVIDAIVAVLDGERRDLGFVAFDEAGLDELQRKVYAATRTVLPGTTVTYGAIARAIGRPDAARDVGAALARNPFPIVVPCHRVVGANGTLTGFSARRAGSRRSDGCSSSRVRRGSGSRRCSRSTERRSPRELPPRIVARPRRL